MKAIIALLTLAVAFALPVAGASARPSDPPGSINRLLAQAKGTSDAHVECLRHENRLQHGGVKSYICSSWAASSCDYIFPWISKCWLIAAYVLEPVVGPKDHPLNLHDLTCASTQTYEKSMRVRGRVVRTNKSKYGCYLSPFTEPAV